ncbi:MAG: tetratricopeptide repeat protein [Candidatus Thorarchaeota archaeon]|jgi:hypothetical protein
MASFVSEGYKPPAWAKVLDAIIELGGSASREQIKTFCIEKFSNTNPNTIDRQIGFEAVNLQGRVNGPENHREGVANDPRYDILYRTGRGEFAQYDHTVHGVWGISRDKDGNLEVIKLEKQGMPDCGNFEAWFQVAELHEIEKRPKMAEDAIRKSLSLNPDNYDAWILLGDAIKPDQSRYSEADEAFKKAIELDSEKTTAWIHYSIHLDKTRYAPGRGELLDRRTKQGKQRSAEIWRLRQERQSEITDTWQEVVKRRAQRATVSTSSAPLDESGTSYETDGKTITVSYEERKLVNAFCDWLLERNVDEPPQTETEDVDIIFKHQGISYAVEAKHAGGKPWRAIRDALGQVLYYEFYPGRERHDTWIILINEQPSPKDTSWIEGLRNRFGEPIFLAWASGDAFSLDGLEIF